MKKRVVFLIALFTIAFNYNALAQNFPNLDKSPMDAASYPANYRISDKSIKVIYSRPQLKGRSLQSLAPNEKVWRTGANEAVEITFYKDVIFGDKEVKAGTYTLFTIPNTKQWTIILSTAKNVWGSYFYNPKEDVVRVKASVSTAKKNIEAFSIVFEGENNKATMYLGWAKTIVTLPIQIVE